MFEWILWLYDEGLDNLYSLTGAETIPLSNDTDVDEYEPQVMEEIEMYENRFLLIRKSIEYS